MEPHAEPPLLCPCDDCGQRVCAKCFKYGSLYPCEVCREWFCCRCIVLDPSEEEIFASDSNIDFLMLCGPCFRRRPVPGSDNTGEPASEPAPRYPCVDTTFIQGSPLTYNVAAEDAALVPQSSLKQRCHICEDSSKAVLPNPHVVDVLTRSNPICLGCWDSFAETLDVTSEREYFTLISFKSESHLSPAGSELATFGSL